MGDSWKKILASNIITSYSAQDIANIIVQYYQRLERIGYYSHDIPLNKTASGVVLGTGMLAVGVEESERSLLPANVHTQELEDVFVLVCELYSKTNTTLMISGRLSGVASSRGFMRRAFGRDMWPFRLASVCSSIGHTRVTEFVVHSYTKMMQKHTFEGVCRMLESWACKLVEVKTKALFSKLLEILGRNIAHLEEATDPSPGTIKIVCLETKEKSNHKAETPKCVKEEDVILMFLCLAYDCWCLAKISTAEIRSSFLPDKPSVVGSLLELRQI